MTRTKEYERRTVEVWANPLPAQSRSVSAGTPTPSAIDGQRFRILTAVDRVSGDCSFLTAAHSIPSQAVAETPDETMDGCGQPEALRLDNRMESACCPFDQ